VPGGKKAAGAIVPFEEATGRTGTPHLNPQKKPPARWKAPHLNPQMKRPARWEALHLNPQPPAGWKLRTSIRK